MRIRIDGDDLVAREARLALRVAGFILVEGSAEADYIVSLTEDEDLRAPVTISGADGHFERLAINRFADVQSSLVLSRSPQRNDRVLDLTIPGTDTMRRATSRALVEIFLLYVSQPVGGRRDVPPPAAPIPQAQALLCPAPSTAVDPTVDLLTHRLVELTAAYVATVEKTVSRAGAVLTAVEAAATDLRLLDVRLQSLNGMIADLTAGQANLMQLLLAKPKPSLWASWFHRAE